MELPVEIMATGSNHKFPIEVCNRYLVGEG